MVSCSLDNIKCMVDFLKHIHRRPSWTSRTILVRSPSPTSRPSARNSSIASPNCSTDVEFLTSGRRICGVPAYVDALRRLAPIIVRYDV